MESIPVLLPKFICPGGLGLSQFSNGQSSQSVAERKAVQGQVNDRATGNARFAYPPCERNRVSLCRWPLARASGLPQKLQSFADINHVSHIARALGV